MNSKLKSIYDPETFRSIGHALIDRLADDMSRSINSERRVIDYRDPSDERNYWENYSYRSVESFLDDFIDRCTDLHNPKYIGHQVATPAPLASLMGLISDHLNNGMGVYEMGMAATVLESMVINTLTRKIGYSEDSGGFLSSGGTLSNLTALLAARNNFRLRHPHKTPIIIVSDQAHFCIERAVSTMGFSKSQLIKVSTDIHYQMNTELLPALIKEYTKEDKGIMCVVGSACSTATGSYDNLHILSQYCRDNDIWLHIDGAHGGPVIFSDKYRYLVSGIEFADSVVIDLHKMLMVPALATAVLFKRSSDSYRCFDQEARYLFQQSEPEWFTLAKRTYETTKYMMGLKFYILQKEYGEDCFALYIDNQYDLARNFYELLSNFEDFESAHQPMSNILCFRYLIKNSSQSVLNELNQYIRSKLLENGEYYVVQTFLGGTYYLRVSLMNPFTDLSHLQLLLHQIRMLAKNWNN